MKFNIGMNRVKNKIEILRLYIHLIKIEREKKYNKCVSKMFFCI